MALADNAIFLIGAQRSGTTWLGKIFDSHPDVLYRHEPDHGDLPPPGLDTAALRGMVERWAANRGQRSAAKRPFFHKAGQPAAAFWLRTGLAAMLAAGGRVPCVRERIAAVPVPDLWTGRRVALKSIDGCDGAGAFARALPDSRTIAIVRHPCGQVASVMRGNRQGRFSLREPGTDMPFDEAPTVRFAADHGTDEATFQALPDAGKYAWDWLRFNHTLMAGLDGQPNARFVVYEDLCRRPAPLARELLAFCGLDWNRQTEAFIANSSTDATATGYYAVFRNSIAAADRWRTSMTDADRDAVLRVIRGSDLARFWPDMAGV